MRHLALAPPSVDSHRPQNRAGVVGLTTALVLRREGYENITVVAKHMPGDRDIEYTSPWAAVNYSPYVLITLSLTLPDALRLRVSAKGSVAEEWDRISWTEFWKLAHETPQAGIEIQSTLAAWMPLTALFTSCFGTDLVVHFQKGRHII